MPADIRSFFGGKTSTPIREKENKKEEESKKKRSKSRKVIDDSDDDEPEPKKSTPKKPAPKKAVKKESPKGKETSTTDYFASSIKPKAKSTPKKPIPAPKLESNGHDDEDAGDDIFAADVKKPTEEKDAYAESESDDIPIVKPKKAATKGKTNSTKKGGDIQMTDATDEHSFVMIDEGEDMMVIDKPAPKSGSKKRKSVDLESEDEELVHKIKSVKSKSAKPPPAKRARAPPTKKAAVPESSAVQSILDDIPTVRAPTPPPQDSSVKFDWKKAQGAGNGGAPPAAGTRDIPTGQENCLVGLTFVFTGILETISREEGQELVKRYGGKITTAPSGKTSYVVLGNEAGPSKLRKIQQMGLKTINEEGLFALISRMPANGGDGKAAEINNEKKKVEMEKIKNDALEMEREEQRKKDEASKARKKLEKEAAAQGSKTRLPPPPPAPSSSQLWTTKYAPTSANQICGNKGQVEKIQKWLKGWSVAHKYDFQKKGADGLGGYRAIMIYGPPGIGKTTAAHLAAKLASYDVLESNASDSRSKSVEAKKGNIVLIMDEVDGMSAGDRGGVGALAKLCKKTDVPMILICNERKLPKMKPFDFVTLDIQFKRPTVEQIRSRIATICHREGLKLPMNVIDALIEGTHQDIRQIINMISTAKLDQTAMDFDQGKSMSKAWEKSVVLKPWDICHKLLGGGLFAPSSKSTLNDKIELYFNDHQISFLMIAENYLKVKPSRANNLSGREQNLKALELVDQAAQSISDGDLVDRMIHGSQQQWSLMPTHAVFSTVIPSSFVSGQLIGETRFPSWLGQNSKQGKLVRYVKEIQSHMRLRTSGDRHEIRQQYLPVLWTRTVKRLENEGKPCVDEVINLMDNYFLTRDDFDYITELGVGPQDQEDVKIDTQTKSTFTRLYNARSHPLPFMKAGNIVAPAAKTKAEVPDLEEAFEEEDEGEVIADPDAKEGEEDLEDSLKKDKYIKKPKAKKATTAKKAPKKKAAKNDSDDDMIDDESEEDVKPTKGKSKAKAATKGKGKK
ncbi:Replication factor C subunit [Lachnellula subtilissima]|uniref:Replication factor C subunit 1 n=1 Tax=Lachnellula subtilissima TaxID=602034 RepID=A0A8H8RTL0_9HELO|nr:Replication factor C subunit [Lachnellula subtilissima]